MNRAARTVIGYPCYQWSTYRMHQYCNWLLPSQQILYTLFNFIHGIVYENHPSIIVSRLEYSMIRSNVTRFVRRPRVKYRSNNIKYELSFLNRGIFLYSKLPEEYVLLNRKQFWINIKDHLKLNINKDTIPKQSDYT